MMPERPKITPPSQGCGAIYLAADVEDYIQRVEFEIRCKQVLIDALEKTLLRENRRA